MNPLQKLKQFFINLISSKLNKTTSLNKVSPNTQIKQIEHSHQQTTFTPSLEKNPEPVTEIPTIIKISSRAEINQLPPGHLLDTCTQINFEDYTEIMKSGHKFVDKLQNIRFYILSKSKDEFVGKKCPKNRPEQVRDVRYTGKPRNFDNNLSNIAKSLGVEIYYVEIENSPEIQDLAVKMLPKLSNFGLHEPDNFFLSFAELTKSSMITSDQDLIRCCKQNQLPFENFDDFAEKVMQGSPITVVLRERRKLRKKQQSRWNQ